VVDDGVQALSKTKDVIEFLKKIGLEKELERISEKKIRAGRGKLRARKYKKRIGPLFVVTEDKGISRAVKNIQGVNVCRPKNLSVVYLAPGTVAGRLTIWSKSAIENLKK
jgi:large subunit ribosomal protein L4e